jgi:exodeoxyribonuclease V alpha subunit
VIEIHASEVERRYALASLATEGSLVIADTREQVADLNAAIRDHHREPAEAGRDGHPVVSSAGEQIGLGDRVATRRNNRDLDVANRDTWTVTAMAEDGSLRVTGRRGERLLPSAYVASHVELAYATTVYGAQGETVGQAHLLVGDSTGAAAAYVGMTRGRARNVAHLVADSPEDARRQWVEVFSRDRADLGPGHAAQVAADDIDRYGPRADSHVGTLQAAALRDERRGLPNEPHLPYPSAPRRSAPGIGR